MALFQPQPGYCCVCGTPGDYKPHSSKGYICSQACHEEYDWQYTLFVRGKMYYPRGEQEQITHPPEYEYTVTTGPRKGWYDPPDLTLDGWELDPDKGRPGESWERFDYHEEMYWRRKIVK